MKISLTRTDCLSIAVTEAIIAEHLGLEGVNFAYSMDLRTLKNFRPELSKVVTIRTPKSNKGRSQKFVVVVGHDSDKEYGYDCEARLYQGDSLLRTFSWACCGSRINLREDSDL